MTAMLLDTFTGRLRLEGVLSSATALHIGAGGSGDTLVGTDSPVVRNAAGAPYIPGSSLKGVVRSAAEALLRRPSPGAGQSAGGVEPLWACNPVGAKTELCVSHERAQKLREDLEQKALREERELESREVAEAIWAESCTVCRLFGSAAFAGRVRFPDLPLLGQAPPLETRNGVGIDRDKELAADGVLYDFEAVPPGTQFGLTVLVDNPTDEEVGLLLYLFEELDLGNLALGGKASRGLGRVHVTWASIVETTLARDNPFARMLSSRDLLQVDAASSPEPESSGPRIPETGDPEAWRALIGLVEALPEINKGLLGQHASEIGLQKDNLNEKLGLGLPEGKARKAWDVALGLLVDCGYLIHTEGGYALAAGVEAETEAPDPGEPTEALQELYDRFVGAMARRWEEAC